MTAIPIFILIDALSAVRVMSRQSAHVVYIAIACSTMALWFMPYAVANAVDASSERFVSVYSGRGVDHNLLELPSALVHNAIKWEDTYLNAAGWFQSLATPAFLQRAFDVLGAPNTQTGLEAIVGKHHGLQDNWELDASYFLRFAGWSPGGLRIRPGIGIGLSYAVGKPTYEDGPEDDPDKRYHLQNFNAYELEWGVTASPRVTVVTRVHHRSGIYGIVAPRHVGSNFLALGVRFGF